jgi:lipoprotein signal peptidase
VGVCDLHFVGLFVDFVLFFYRCIYICPTTAVCNLFDLYCVICYYYLSKIRGYMTKHKWLYKTKYTRKNKKREI